MGTMLCDQYDLHLVKLLEPQGLNGVLGGVEAMQFNMRPQQW